MGRRAIAVLLAGLIAVLGAAAVLIYARGADARAVAGADPRTVYVSEKPVSAGTSLADAVRDRALVKTQVAARAFPVGALAEVTPTNEALVAITDIGVGEYVLASRFGTTPTGRRAIQVPPGQVAVSVRLEDPARVGEFRHPGVADRHLRYLRDARSHLEPDAHGGKPNPNSSDACPPW